VVTLSTREFEDVFFYRFAALGAFYVHQIHAVISCNTKGLLNNLFSKDKKKRAKNCNKIYSFLTYMKI
jgi:hypothetical protein